MAGIPQILQEVFGNGSNCCRNTEAMKFVVAGNLRGVFGKSATMYSSRQIITTFSMRWMTYKPSTVSWQPPTVDGHWTVTVISAQSQVLNS